MTTYSDLQSYYYNNCTHVVYNDCGFSFYCIIKNNMVYRLNVFKGQPWKDVRTLKREGWKFEEIRPLEEVLKAWREKQAQTDNDV